MVYEIDRYGIWTGVSVEDSRKDELERYTDIEPPSDIPDGSYAQLRHRTWVIVEEIPQGDLERERSNLINKINSRIDELVESVRWRITRYHDQVATNTEPTEDIAPLLLWIQALRDISSQTGYPETITWPQPEDYEGTTFTYKKIKSLVSALFSTPNEAFNRWLDIDGRSSDRWPYKLPVTGMLTTITFSNHRLATGTIEIWTYDDADRGTKIYEFELRNEQTKTINVSPSIEVTTAERLAVFSTADSAEVSPDCPLVGLYFEANELNDTA